MPQPAPTFVAPPAPSIAPAPTGFAAPVAATSLQSPRAPQAPGINTAGNFNSPAGFSDVSDSSDFDETGEEFEATIVIARGRSTTKWNLIDIDGTKFPLAPMNVLGRKPTSGPEDAQLIALSDPQRVLSRTHLLIEIEDDQLWVTDLKSTNGTEIVLNAGESADEASALDPDDPENIRPCEALNRYAVTADQGLSLGGRTITFDRP